MISDTLISLFCPTNYSKAHKPQVLNCRLTPLTDITINFSFRSKLFHQIFFFLFLRNPSLVRPHSQPLHRVSSVKRPIFNKPVKKTWRKRSYYESWQPPTVGRWVGAVLPELKASRPSISHLPVSAGLGPDMESLTIRTEHHMVQ